MPGRVPVRQIRLCSLRVLRVFVTSCLRVAVPVVFSRPFALSLFLAERADRSPAELALVVGEAGHLGGHVEEGDGVGGQALLDGGSNLSGMLDEDAAGAEGLGDAVEADLAQGGALAPFLGAAVGFDA